MNEYTFIVMTLKSYWTNKAVVELTVTAKNSLFGEMIISDLFSNDNMDSTIYSYELKE